MVPLRWSIEFKRLELKYAWAISRSSVNFKINAYITVTDGNFTGIGEAAPNSRYGEDPVQFESIFSTLDFISFKDANELEIWLHTQKVPNSLRFGIESAFIHFLAQSKNQSVWEFLRLKLPTGINTAYTIPIMPEEAMENYFLNYSLHRFKFIKVKVNGDNMVPFVREVRKHLSNTLIIDANEAYTDPDKFLADIDQLSGQDIAFVEQPLPVSMHDESEYIKDRCPFLLFADESITDKPNFPSLQKAFHGVNIKLMKAGGYLNAIQLLQEAKSYGMKTMIGCMVESGLGISSGYNLSSLADFSDLDSFLILKDDPFPYVREKEGILFLSGQVNQA